VNIFWLYKYTEGWAYVTKKDNAIFYFIVFFFIGIIMPYLFQKDLNEIARNYGRQQMMGLNTPSQQYLRYPNYSGGQGGKFKM
jgi:quinol-cytochrome oxidoreductase complex cytochrome b subunit